jgi:hypothetical protein
VDRKAWARRNGPDTSFPGAVHFEVTVRIEGGTVELATCANSYVRDV